MTDPVADPLVMTGFHDYLGLHPILVNHDDSETEIKRKIEEVGQGEAGGSPAGRGRLVQLPPGRLTTQELTLQQAQSLRGVKGSSLLTLADGAPLSDRGGGIKAYIGIANDFRVLDDIAGQGVIEDLDIDAKNTKTMAGTIHGLFAPDRGSNPANLHTLRNVAVYNARNDGVHFDAGNDKLVCDRLRSEGCNGVGIYLAGGDVKARAIGSAAKGSALTISGAAVELDQFDLWRPTTNDDVPTLEIIGGANGCVIKSGTVEGKTRFSGKNKSNDGDYSPRFLNSRAQFAFVHFKHDIHQARDCYFESRSADLVELISCKFGLSGPDVLGQTVTLYNYLIKISLDEGDTDLDNLGLVKISGGSGMLRYLGRPGDNIAMRMDCLTHFCNYPRLVQFDWGRPGQVEIVPNWAVDSPDPRVRTHVRMDGVQRTKEDFPFGFLAYGIGKGPNNSQPDRTLDDGLGSAWTVPILPDVSSDYCYAMRVLP